MLGSKRFEIAIAALMALVVIATGVITALGHAGLTPSPTSPAYTSRLFDDSRVHEVDIVIDNWDAFLTSAPEEEYSLCSVVVDGEQFDSVGIRAKGNNSKNLVEEHGLSRYSLKLEFDHYVAGGSYHGLDKMSLDASFQDNAYLKNYLAYDMMRHMGVPAPLCSYTWVTVNGEPWGLFLAVEEPEEAFARRNFGVDHGHLYKPDYLRLEDENADLALRYIDDDPASYDNIFRTERFDSSTADHLRVITALEVLNGGAGAASAGAGADPSAADSSAADPSATDPSAPSSAPSSADLESVIFLNETISYFAVHSFTVSLDSYLGRTGHNYLLYEEGGRIGMLPWDYNLAFGTYMLGMPNPIDDANVIINYPIDTPAPGEYMVDRPLFHNLMQNNDCFALYHSRYEELIEQYFESGLYEVRITETARMIAPYVQADPTAFCSYEDHVLAVETLKEFCRLRAESVRGQLDGQLPSTFAEQERAGAADAAGAGAGAGTSGAGVDASSIDVRDLGEIADLRD